MTTIIGVQYEGSCFLAADSRTTNEIGRPYHHEKVSKITSRAGYLIAGAGDPQACDIIQHMWNPPKNDKKLDDYEFFVTKVCGSIRDCLEKNKYQKDKSDKDGGFIFLIAYNGIIYEVDETFTIYLREDGVYGIGSGARYAVGAIQAGADWEKALEIAEKNDIYTGSPFTYFKQEA